MANTLKESITDDSAPDLEWKIQLGLNSLINRIPRVAIVIGLFGLIAAEVLLVSNNNLTFGLALASVPFIIIGAILLIYHIDYSPLAIFFTAAFIPLKLPTGTGSPIVGSLVVAIGVTLVWILKMGLVDKKLALKPSPANAPAIGFIVVTLVSLIWSNLLRDPIIIVPKSFVLVQLGAASVMVISPAVTLLTENLITSEKLLKIMVGILLVVGVIGLAENFLNVNLYTVIGGLTSAWVVALAFGLALFNDRLKTTWKVLLLSLTGLWFLWNLVLNLNWYAGWVPGLVAVGVIAFLRSKRLFLAVLMIFALYVVLNFQSINDNIAFKQTNDGDTRLAAWNINWAITSQHLILGTGPAGYAAYYMTLVPNEAMATHNNYIDIISETGVIGTFFYLWLFGALSWQGYQVVRRLRRKRDFNEALAVATFGGLIGCVVIMAFGDWMLPFAYTQTIAGFNYTIYSWLFIGALLALDQITRYSQVLDA